MNEKYYNYKAPRKPLIRKLGTIKCDVVETTPIVFRGRLYRLEYVRSHRQNEANNSENTWLHFVDVYTNGTTKPLAHGHHFGTAFADEEWMYVAAIVIASLIKAMAIGVATG